jgi:hypothetical protein
MLVSIDGRRETVYSDDVQRRHFEFYFDRPGGATLPTDLRADYIWVPRILPAVRRLRSDRSWTAVYEGKQSIIFERSGLPRQQKSSSVVATAATTPRYFPGP